MPGIFHENNILQYNKCTRVYAAFVYLYTTTHRYVEYSWKLISLIHTGWKLIVSLGRPAQQISEIHKSNSK